MEQASEPPPVSRYCQRHAIFNIDMCIVFSRLPGHVAGYHLRFSGQFPQGRGWGAFAYGSVMDGAVMFVFYPDQKNNGLTVGLRSTSGHYPPKLSVDQGNLLVSQTFIDHEGYYIANLRCDDCKPKEGAGDEGIENWIWSANDHQIIQSDDPGHEIQMHMAYGTFQTLISAQDNATELTRIHDVFSSRVNVNAWEPDHPFSHEYSQSTLNARYAHALFMLTAFLIAFPLGVLGLRHGGNKVFRLHVGIQLTTTIVLIMGGILGVYLATSHKQYIELVCHESIGALVFLLITAQVTLGFLHHKRFLVTAKRTEYAKWHRPLGYIIILMGTLNGTLGLRVTSTTWTFAYTTGLAAVVLVTWLFLGLVLYIRERRGRIHGDT